MSSADRHIFFQLFLATMSKQVSMVLRNIGSINTIHCVPPQGHIQGQTPGVYIFRLISCLKGFTLFYHILHKGGMHMSLEITKKKMKHAFNKYKTHSIVLKSKRWGFMNLNRH